VLSGDRSLIVVAFVVLGLAFVLDVLTPPDLEWAEFYLVAIAVMAWAVGWSKALVFSVMVVLIAMAVDAGAIRPLDVRPGTTALVWNAISELVIYTVVAIATDRARRGRERQQTENREQARLLQLLEREFPRPLRAVYWFALKFDETFGPEATLTENMAGQLASLRHHVREINFLATDLLRIGRLQIDGLRFGQESVDLKRTVADAVSESLDRRRVVLSASAEDLIVRADPASLHHAIASIIGRLLEGAPVHEVVQVFVRGSGGEGVVEFASRGDGFGAEHFELADLLTKANGGRLAIIPRGADLGVRVNLHVPRTTPALATPPASPSVA
jgi:signal transduction histidine kinase